MRTVRVDFLQDPEHRGHHLDREISNLKYADLDRYEEKSRALISMLQGVQFCAPDGLEMVAVIAVRSSKSDDALHFGGGDAVPIKAGMLYISDNHFTVWLSDAERRAKYLITSFFLKETMIFCSGHPEELQDFMRSRVIEGVERLIQKEQKEISELLEELKARQESLNTLIQGRTRL